LKVFSPTVWPLSSFSLMSGSPAAARKVASQAARDSVDCASACPPYGRNHDQGPIGGTGLTQFGRALHDLNIDILYANSPQAKGRVERMNKTLQDRLVKELRLEGIDTLEAGNAYLSAFMERFNTKFAQAPANATDLHRPLTELDDVLWPPRSIGRPAPVRRRQRLPGRGY